MEDYTYHMDQQLMTVLGAHMLEICPTITDQQPGLDVQPLSIGGKGDPVRLVFSTRTGPAINASVMDMGNRFRMVVNEVEVEAGTPLEVYVLIINATGPTKLGGAEWRIIAPDNMTIRIRSHLVHERPPGPLSDKPQGALGKKAALCLDALEDRGEPTALATVLVDDGGNQVRAPLALLVEVAEEDRRGMLRTLHAARQVHARQADLSPRLFCGNSRLNV